MGGNYCHAMGDLDFCERFASHECLPAKLPYRSRKLYSPQTRTSTKSAVSYPFNAFRNLYFGQAFTALKGPSADVGDRFGEPDAPKARATKESQVQRQIIVVRLYCLRHHPGRPRKDYLRQTLASFESPGSNPFNGIRNDDALKVYALLKSTLPDFSHGIRDDDADKIPAFIESVKFYCRRSFRDDTDPSLISYLAIALIFDCKITFFLLKEKAKSRVYISDKSQKS